MKKKSKHLFKLFGGAALSVALSLTLFGCSFFSEPPSDNDQTGVVTPNPDTGDSPDDASGDNAGEPSGKDPTPPEEPEPDPEPELPDSFEKPVAPPEEYDCFAWEENFALPDADEALERLNEIYGGANKVFLLQSGRIARMPCPQGETITLNMTYELGEYARLILEDSVTEFNEVFSVINPNYRFAINYAPTDDDFAQKYSVRMSASENLAVNETSQVFGLAHVSYYANFTELGDFGITMKTSVLDDGRYLMMTFKHELMHLLGAGDAYKNANATKATVMQSYTVNGYHNLSQTDVAFLDTLYRNPALNDAEADILGYIENYERTNTHSKADLTAAVYRKLADNLDPATVIREAVDIGYKDLTEFSELIQNGVVRDVMLGETEVAFTEIEYAETPSETYFGKVVPQTGKYWHGRQTSIGSSQSCNYTEYGSGILYAAPNGNLYMFLIKTGNYYLTFRLYGSFSDLPQLALGLWHISR